VRVRGSPESAVPARPRHQDQHAHCTGCDAGAARGRGTGREREARGWLRCLGGTLAETHSHAREGCNRGAPCPALGDVVTTTRGTVTRGCAVLCAHSRRGARTCTLHTDAHTVVDVDAIDRDQSRSSYDWKQSGRFLRSSGRSPVDCGRSPVDRTTIARSDRPRARIRARERACRPRFGPETLDLT
jgi:hypothetical protein